MEKVKPMGLEGKKIFLYVTKNKMPFSEYIDIAGRACFIAFYNFTKFKPSS